MPIGSLCSFYWRLYSKNKQFCLLEWIGNIWIGVNEAGTDKNSIDGIPWTLAGQEGTKTGTHLAPDLHPNMTGRDLKETLARHLASPFRRVKDSGQGCEPGTKSVSSTCPSHRRVNCQIDLVAQQVIWFFTVDGHGEPEGGGPDRKESHPSVVAKPRAKRRNNTLMAVRYQRGETNGDAKPIAEAAGKPDDRYDSEPRKEVKTERLSPGGGPSSLADQNSNSSRSCTPSSSYPSTPPDPPSHLKQMEQMMMARNYSDFMRSLAAKYNHTNPNE